MKKIEVMQFDGNIVAKHKFGAHEGFPLHVHSYYEIYLSLSDNIRFFVGENIYDVNRNDMFLFNSSDAHCVSVIENEDSYERYVVNFHPSIFQKYPTEFHRFATYFDNESNNRRIKVSLSNEIAKEVIKLINNIIELDASSRNYQLKSLMYLIEIFIIIDENSTIETLDKYETTDDKVKQIMKYIRQHYDSPLSLEELGKKFFFNKYYLCRIFKEKTGFNISQYIESCRISKAMILLKNGMSVSEVALNTGYGSDTYFISVFKKNLGISPKQYKKKMVQE